MIILRDPFIRAVCLKRDEVPDLNGVTKDFLNRHERMTEILLGDEERDLKKTER